MNESVIKIENLSKQYRLGQVGTGTLSHDLNRWWHRIRGKEDPYLKIGETNDRSTAGDSDYAWALQDINLEVKHGEVLGIIGKNGAGKSTLLKILSKVTGPTTGSIKTKGRIASLLEVGTGFHPELSGRENIYMNGTIMGMSRKEISSKLDEIVEFAGVERYLDTPVKRYSSGMKVRLGFAVAAHLEPEILVVDEVLAVGDAEFQKKAIGKMKDVSQGQGRTVLFVSHNMASIQKLCSKSIILDNGTITFCGDTSKAIENYLSTTNENVATKLLNRDDRTGNGKIRFTNYEILSDCNKKISHIISGMDIVLRLSYQTQEAIPNTNILIEFIASNSNSVLFSCGNYFVDTSYKMHHPRGYISFKIPNIPLPPGEYTFNIKSASGKTYLDNIDSAGCINVEKGDFYGSGKVDNISRGLLVPHKTSNHKLM